jgi:hypothetical protein
VVLLKLSFDLSFDTWFLVLFLLYGDDILREYVVTDVLFVFEHFFYSSANHIVAS